MSQSRLQHRIEKLEQRLSVLQSPPTIAMRVIVAPYAGGPPNLENSTYRQLPWGAGSFMELIHLDGRASDATEEAELEAWIARQAAKAERERVVTLTATS